MKKTLSLVALLFVTNLAISQSKVAHVNSQSLLDTMPSRDLALKEIKEIEDEFKLELNGMYEEYEKTRAKLEGERATLSPTIIKSREANLMNLGQRIQEREQTVQSELQVRAQELNQPIFDRVKQAVDIVAEGSPIPLEPKDI